MKNIIIFIIFCSIASIYFVSCLEDCKASTNCGAHGTCLNNICACEFGYEGDFCDKIINTKYIGRWKGQELQRHGFYTDTVTLDWKIEQVSDSVNKISITNQNEKKIKMNTGSAGYGVYYFYTQNQVVLDSLNIISGASISMGKTNDTIYYNANYKPIGANSSFSGYGVFIKQ